MVCEFSSRGCFSADALRALPKTTKGDEGNIGSTESEHSTQASHMMMVQSGSSMVNIERKKKSIPPAKKCGSSNIAKQIDQTKTNAVIKSTTSRAILKYE